MNNTGIAIYVDTTITKEMIRDLGNDIKKELLSYIDNIGTHDPSGYDVTIFIDKNCEVNEELREIVKSFADAVMEVSINEKLAEGSKNKEEYIAKEIIDVMNHTIFQYKYPLVFHIADVCNIASLESFDNRIHQYLCRGVNSKTIVKYKSHNAVYFDQPLLTVFEYDPFDYELYINRYGYNVENDNNARLLNIQYCDKNTIRNAFSRKSVLKHL